MVLRGNSKIEQTLNGAIQEHVWGRPVSACPVGAVTVCTMSLFLGREIPSELKTVVHTTLDGTTKIIGAVCERN
ncbi:hypothetical protein CWB72_02115 [Pseudoalteromonas phenolica]|nr:hypothetical protein CWB72_02115 [Pseudoalteromonas phenolica]